MFVMSLVYGLFVADIFCLSVCLSFCLLLLYVSKQVSLSARFNFALILYFVCLSVCSFD